MITRRVRLFVSRLDTTAEGAATTLVVRERIPVSEVSAVEVHLRTQACHPEPAEGPDAEGVVCYALRLAPGERQEIVMEYELRASGAVVGL